MRIGILTWFYGANYGAKLQAYAIQKVLEEEGHDCSFVDYKAPGFSRINIKMNLNYAHYKRHPLRYLKCLFRCIRMWDFAKAFPKTNIVRDAKAIDELGFDRILIGGDAVFNIKHPFYNSIYYGVGIDKTPKFSYAPSCEYCSPNESLDAGIVKSLSGFIGISVRDDNTRLLIKNNANVDPITVLDPTFLYDFTHITPRFKYNDYLLLYTFSDWSVYKPQILQYAKNNKLMVISIGRYYSWADVSLDAASLFEWLSAIKYASVVFTDSFHGLCFSIKNNKQFVVVGRPDKVDKNRELMKLLGIDKRFYSGEDRLEEGLFPLIDYSVVNDNVKHYTNISKKYLRKCIEGYSKG